MATKYGPEGRKTKTSKDSKVSSHPYQQYMSSPMWNIVNAGIDDLVKNGDLIEQTNRNYIVGYLCKVLLTNSKHT